MTATDRGGLAIYTDGASRGNPGPAAYAYLFVRDGEVVHEASGLAGVTTNNTAEYMAVINALREARSWTDGPVDLYSDSELVVRQLRGEYRVNKEHLRALREEVFALAGAFSAVTFSSVRRSDRYVSRADALCNLELDRRERG
ncbi:ribonuclease HI family protein [Methanofollis formosanus]|uniref:Ribonuclease HI family protein n=1 Tax=Methanofollis formosanus TaxID=299308 RepID=A0A8G1A2H3_9EURY|nr:ribonuclease HI family protein [Methanofollis formosanus]QYZ78867.1 ribonuclease HI family protein [Methanofollis formosanus]